MKKFNELKSTLNYFLFEMFLVQEYLRLVLFFFFSHFFGDRINSFNKKTYPIKILLWEFESNQFPIWLCSGLNYARFENFFHNAESLTRNIY